MAIETYSKSGTRASTPAKLDKNVFGEKPISHQLLKDAYLTHLSNARTNLAKTKKRGEVRGGGAKPWRQKGTGRARTGSIRSPIWRGGGVTFGPTGEENYYRKISPRVKRQALRQALSMAADENRIKVIDSINLMEGTVKSAVKLLTKIKAEGNVLLIVEQRESMVERSIRNLPNVKLVRAAYLSVYDILNANTIVISKKSLEILSGWLSVKKSSTSTGKSK